MPARPSEIIDAIEVFKDYTFYGEGELLIIPDMETVKTEIKKQATQKVPVELPIDQIETHHDWGRRIKPPELYNPIIVLKFPEQKRGKNHVVLDGQHRIFSLADMGEHTVEAYVIELSGVTVKPSFRHTRRFGAQLKDEPIVEDADNVDRVLGIGDEVNTPDGPGVVVDIALTLADYNGEVQLEPPSIAVELEDDAAVVYVCLCEIGLEDKEAEEIVHSEFDRLWPPMTEGVPEDAEQLIPEEEDMQKQAQAITLDTFVTDIIAALCEFDDYDMISGGYAEDIVTDYLEYAALDKGLLLDLLNSAPELVSRAFPNGESYPIGSIDEAILVVLEVEIHNRLDTRWDEVKECFGVRN